MNFKIESKFLDITNYPYIEKHFENMASRGWMITKILMGRMFIYKKIQPEALDFSIAPYEDETIFTRRTEEELEEFQSVCELVGWNCKIKLNDLYIYFKKAGSEAIDISTDEEEEFNTLERIGKEQLKPSYVSVPLYLFLSWTILRGLFNDVHSLKDGMNQIVGLIIPIFFISSIYQIVRIKSFLKTNRKNMEQGKSLEYNDSKFLFERATFWIYWIFIIFFIAYIIYDVFVLDNKSTLIALAPLFIGLTIGIFYRMFIKPAKKTIKYKKIFLGAALILSAIVSINVVFISLNSLAMKKDNPNIEGYKVISANNFSDQTVEDDGDLIRNFSFLIPTSYTYWSWPEGNISVKTEYSNTLTKGIAKNLVNRYKKQAEKYIEDRISWEIDTLVEENIYDYSLQSNGISEEEFNSLKVNDIKEARKEAIDISKEKSIIKDKENLWNLDEVYYLNYDKTEILIREGKEVFYLEGKDFSDSEIIKIVKDKLEL